MASRPTEDEGQVAVKLRLRYLIDTARSYPSQANIDRAIAYAVAHPYALRSSHLRHNLGKARWTWLAEYGVYFPGEPLTVAGIDGIKGTITPEVIKEGSK